MAITDHECISNSVKVLGYYKKVKEQHPDFKVVLGNEIYLCRSGLSNDNFVSGTDRYYHFILLAKDAEGHRQIREISTRAWMRSYMARGMRRVPTYYQDLIDIIGSNPGHVIGSTACLGGALPTQLLRILELSRGTSKNGQALALIEKVKTWIVQMDEVFGHGNFFFEMQPSYNSEQIYVNKELLKLSKRFDIPYIITTDSHYLKKEDRFVHKAFLNSQKGDREVDDFYASTYMMDTEELEKYFSYLSKEELQKAYTTIQSIFDSCEDYDLAKPLKIPKLTWQPVKYEQKIYEKEFDEWCERIPMFRTFMQSEDLSDRYLIYKIIDGIKEHSDLQNEEAYNEINSNLEMINVSSKINNASWSSYILNLQRIIDVCWEAGSIVGPGRGSGVGFILLYVLEITQINPLREKTKTFSWRLTLRV